MERDPGLVAARIGMEREDPNPGYPIPTRRSPWPANVAQLNQRVRTIKTGRHHGYVPSA
jgi:hypothetical protein